MGRETGEISPIEGSSNEISKKSGTRTKDNQRQEHKTTRTKTTRTTTKQQKTTKDNQRQERNAPSRYQNNIKTASKDYKKKRRRHLRKRVEKHGGKPPEQIPPWLLPWSSSVPPASRSRLFLQNRACSQTVAGATGATIATPAAVSS